MRTLISLVILSLFSLLIMACGASATASPDPTDTAASTASPTQTSAPTSESAPASTSPSSNNENSSDGAQEGDKVSVHYVGTLDDGSVFDSSRERGAPLEFSVGEGGMIEGFDKGVIGMQVGETKRIHIPVDQAYGPYRPEMVMEVDRSQWPESMELKIGEQVQTSVQGQPIRFTITDISDSTVTLDANHRLAGKDLTFEIEMVAIN